MVPKSIEKNFKIHPFDDSNEAAQWSTIICGVMQKYTNTTAGNINIYFGMTCTTLGLIDIALFEKGNLRKYKNRSNKRGNRGIDASKTQTSRAPTSLSFKSESNVNCL